MTAALVRLRPEDRTHIAPKARLTVLRGELRKVQQHADAARSAARRSEGRTLRIMQSTAERLAADATVRRLYITAFRMHHRI